MATATSGAAASALERRNELRGTASFITPTATTASPLRISTTRPTRPSRVSTSTKSPIPTSASLPVLGSPNVSRSRRSSSRPCSCARFSTRLRASRAASSPCSDADFSSRIVRSTSTRALPCIFGNAASLSLGRGQRFLARLEVRKKRGDSSFVDWYALISSGEDFARKIQAPSDADSVRATRDSLGEPISRGERHGVELKRRIDDAIDLRRKLLQRSEMCGSYRKRSTSGKRLENRAAQRRALDGIGAGAE